MTFRIGSDTPVGLAFGSATIAGLAYGSTVIFRADNPLLASADVTLTYTNRPDVGRGARNYTWNGSPRANLSFNAGTRTLAITYIQLFIQPPTYIMEYGILDRVTGNDILPNEARLTRNRESVTFTTFGSPVYQFGLRRTIVDSSTLTGTGAATVFPLGLSRTIVNFEFFRR